MSKTKPPEIEMHSKMFKRILVERLKKLSDERLLMVYAWWRAYEKKHLKKGR
jgi:hypothetical protein